MNQRTNTRIEPNHRPHLLRPGLMLAATLFLLAAWSLPAFAGCYDEKLGEEYTLRVGEQMCLKNRKWNCKPVCFYYAGMISDKGFSLLVPRQQGGMNLYYPSAKGGTVTLVHHLFEVINVSPRQGTFKYKGEDTHPQKKE